MSITAFTRRPAVRRHDRGAAAVEFALVLIVLMLIVAGIVEIGRALWYYDALAKGTRDAARHLSTVSAGQLNGGLDAAQSIILAAGAEARVPGLLASHVTVDCNNQASQTCSTVPVGSVNNVTVSVSYPMTLGTWIPLMPVRAEDDFGIAITLQPHTTMRSMW